MEIPRKIKIALILGNISLGGVSVSVYNYAKYLDSNVFELHFFIYGDSYMLANLEEIGTVHHQPSFVNFPKAMRIWDNHLKNNQYDIVHSHITSLSVFPLYIARKNKIAHRICHAHSTAKLGERNSLVKYFLRSFSTTFSTNLMSCSQKSAKWLYGKKAKDCFLLPNAIELSAFAFDKYNRDEVRSQLGINCFCIGFIGRFEYQKNLFFLLKVMRELVKVSKCHLLLIGDGSDKDKLIATIDKYNIAEYVTILPPQKDIQKYYSAMDCFCLPSRYEGFPLVCVEAMANGLQVIASDRITSEVGMVKNAIDFCPIRVEDWTAQINKLISKNSINRYDAIPLLTELGYNIEDNANLLSNYYKHLMEDIK